MTIKDVLSAIEQLENIFDNYNQALQKNIKELISQMTTSWQKMKAEEKEMEALDAKIAEQNSELTELRTQAEDLDKKKEDLTNKKNESTTKNSELTANLEKTIDEMKKPKFELENIDTKLTAVNEKIATRETEQEELEKKKFENESKESDLRDEYKKKNDDLNASFNEEKQSSFFSWFLMEHSDQDIHEVDILASIIELGNCKLDEVKKQLDIPPIMAVRTIKQLALKEIINLNEDTNEISLP